MIGIYATPDAAYAAAETQAALFASWPQLATVASDGAVLPELPFIGDGARPAWDDLLIVLFGAAPLPAALHGPIQREIDNARREKRASRVLPVSTLDGHRRPPAPLEAVFALHCPEPYNAAGARLARRVGALLALWLRGDDRKVFVSHRQADGQAVAIQITDYLQKHGYDAWRDEERLDGGDVVQDEIERSIAKANLLLLVDTPRAGESEWVAREIDAAIAGFVLIVSVVLRPTGATGSAAEPSVYGAKELRNVRIEADTDAAGVVEPLTDARLADLLAGVEHALSSLLRSQMDLASKVEQTFRDFGFDWQALDAQRFLYAGAKQENEWTFNRFLSHCSSLPPTHLWSVQALRRYRPEGGDPSRHAFNHRLFIYDEGPVPDPTLKRLARDHEAYRDPILRLLHTSRLAAFLSKYQ
jgi:hypothetical protein